MTEPKVQEAVGRQVDAAKQGTDAEHPAVKGAAEVYDQVEWVERTSVSFLCRTQSSFKEKFGHAPSVLAVKPKFLHGIRERKKVTQKMMLGVCYQNR